MGRISGPNSCFEICLRESSNGATIEGFAGSAGWYRVSTTIISMSVLRKQHRVLTYVMKRLWKLQEDDEVCETLNRTESESVADL